MGLDPSTHAPITTEANPTDPEKSVALALMRHKAQWENARLEAESRFSRASLLMSTNNSTALMEMTTMPNNNPPADYFLRIWNSEAGKSFRKENHHPNGGGDPVLLPETPLNSVSSLCCATTQNNRGQSSNPNDKDNDNSASFEWFGDCNVNTTEESSCFPDIGHMTMGQTEDKAAKEFLFLELLYFTDNDNNNNNTNSIQTELIAGFQQPPVSPWPELHQEDYSNNMSFNAHDASSQYSSDSGSALCPSNLCTVG